MGMSVKGHPTTSFPSLGSIDVMIPRRSFAIRSSLRHRTLRAASPRGQRPARGTRNRSDPWSGGALRLHLESTPWAPPGRGFLETHAREFLEPWSSGAAARIIAARWTSRCELVRRLTISSNTHRCRCVRQTADAYLPRTRHFPGIRRLRPEYKHLLSQLNRNSNCGKIKAGNCWFPKREGNHD